MRSVEQHQPKQMPELAQSWITQDNAISPHEKTLKKVGERVPDSENSPLEVRTLVAQCSILVVIAGFVAWLIAA